jgi:hypothetical protein
MRPTLLASASLVAISLQASAQSRTDPLIFSGDKGTQNGVAPLDGRVPPVLSTAVQPGTTVDQRGPGAGDNMAWGYTPAFAGAGTLNCASSVVTPYCQGSLWQSGGRVWQENYDASANCSAAGACSVFGAGWLDITPQCLPLDCLGEIVTGYSGISGGGSYVVGDPVIGESGNTVGTVTAVGAGGTPTTLTLANRYYGCTSGGSTSETFHASPTQTNTINGSFSVGSSFSATLAIGYWHAAGVDKLTRCYNGPAINVTPIGQPASVTFDIPFSSGHHIDMTAAGSICGLTGCRVNVPYDQGGAGLNDACNANQSYSVTATGGGTSTVYYDERPYFGPQMHSQNDGIFEIAFDAIGSGRYLNPKLTACRLNPGLLYYTTNMTAAFAYDAGTSTYPQSILYMPPVYPSTKSVLFANYTYANFSFTFGCDAGRAGLPLPNRNTGNLVVASSSLYGTALNNSILTLYDNDVSMQSCTDATFTHQVAGQSTISGVTYNGYIGYETVYGAPFNGSPGVPSSNAGLSGPGQGFGAMRDYVLGASGIAMGEGLEGQTFEASIWQETNGFPQDEAYVCWLGDSHNGTGAQYLHTQNRMFEEMLGRKDISFSEEWQYGYPLSTGWNSIFQAECANAFTHSAGPAQKVLVLMPSQNDFSFQTNNITTENQGTLSVLGTALNSALAYGYDMVNPCGTIVLGSYIGPNIGSNPSPGDIGYYNVTAAPGSTLCSFGATLTGTATAGASNIVVSAITGSTAVGNYIVATNGTLGLTTNTQITSCPDATCATVGTYGISSTVGTTTFSGGFQSGANSVLTPTAQNMETFMSHIASVVHATYPGAKVLCQTDPNSSGITAPVDVVNAWCVSPTGWVQSGGDGIYANNNNNPVFNQTLGGSFTLGPPNCFTSDNIHFEAECQAILATTAMQQAYFPQALPNGNSNANFTRP